VTRSRDNYLENRRQLEPIRQIDIARSADNELIHIYVTHEGKNYYDPSRTPAEILELTNQQTVYYTNLS